LFTAKTSIGGPTFTTENLEVIFVYFKLTTNS
jgi:hypothetical protein